MSRLREHMQFTLREWRVPLTLWAVLSTIAALAGPFGTMNALSFGPRAFYWAAIIALAILLDRWFSALETRLPKGLKVNLGVVLAYALVLASLIWGLNHILFPDWGSWREWLWLLLIILVISGSVHLVLRLQTTPASPLTEFQRRLQIKNRGKLIRLEAQDHYVLVVTSAGQELVLMRLSDAAQELGPLGLRVHRSHWISPEAVVQTRRKHGRTVLVMVDGAEVPVSRSYLKALAQAGIAPA